MSGSSFSMLYNTSTKFRSTFQHWNIVVVVVFVVVNPFLFLLTFSKFTKQYGLYSHLLPPYFKHRASSIGIVSSIEF